MTTSRFPFNMTNPFSNPSLTTSLTLAGGTAVLTLLVLAYRDCQFYISMGPHGLPDTLQGWIRQLRMSKHARKDVLEPAPYAHDTQLTTSIKTNLGPNAEKSFFSQPLPQRQGPRPQVPGFVAPQRQTSDQASSATKTRMTEFLDELGDKNPKLLLRSLSRLEKHALGVQLASSLTTPKFLSSTRGEILHVHPPDGSTHVVLSLEDSKRLIEKGWGQRHRLSGGLLPWSYTLMYAPRDDAEMEVWKNVVVAGVRFGTAEFGTVDV